MTDKSDILEQMLSLIIANTKRRDRAKSIPDIAKAIQTSVDILGTIGSVSDAVLLSPKMLRQFLSVQSLEPNVQKLFCERTLDSVDLASQLATLPISDQLILASHYAENKIETKDVRAFRELRRRDTKSSTQDIIDAVVSSKIQKHYVIDFVLRGGIHLSEASERIAHYVGENNIIKLSQSGQVAQLILNADGVQKLRATAKILSVTFEQVISEIIKHKLK